MDVIKELSLRMRGQKEVEKLLKRRRRGKNADTASQALLTQVSDEDEDEEDEDEDEGMEMEIEDGAEGDFSPQAKHALTLQPESEINDLDTWHEISDSDSDAVSVISTASRVDKNKILHTSRSPTLGILIEDSDWDDVEVLD